jgi:ABC-type branched-subunit amino acid transport system substrate-binding protein
LAIIDGPYDWEINTTKGAREVAEKLGWEVVVNEQVPYDTKEWSGILSKIRAANPSLIYLELLDPASVNAMISQFHDNPSKQSLLYAGYSVSVPAFGEIIKTGAAEGVLGMTLSAQRPDDKGRAFAEKWRQKYNEEPPLSVAAQIYDEVMLWAAAVNKAGSATDYNAIAAALRDNPYDGITGVVKFNDQQYVTSSDETVPTQLLQVQGNGVKQVMIGTKKNVAFETPPWIK